MDYSKALEKIKENLKESIDELVQKWNKIFIEYQYLLATGKSEEAINYIARHLGELDMDFSLYFIPYIQMLKKKGITKGAEIQEKLLESFKKHIQDFRVERTSRVAKEAFEVTEEIEKNWKSKE